MGPSLVGQPTRSPPEPCIRRTSPPLARRCRAVMAWYGMHPVQRMRSVPATTWRRPLLVLSSRSHVNRLEAVQVLPQRRHAIWATSDHAHWALTSLSYQPSPREESEVVGCHLLGHAHLFGDLTDRPFTVPDYFEDLAPGAIAECPEESVQSTGRCAHGICSAEGISGRKVESRCSVVSSMAALRTHLPRIRSQSDLRMPV